MNQNIKQVSKKYSIHRYRMLLFREIFWHEYAKIPKHTAWIYVISINSVHREACY